MADADSEIEPMAPTKDWDYRGALLFRPNPEEMEQSRTHGTPVVNLSAEDAAFDPVSVHADNHAIGKVAAEYLLSLGYQKFAFWGDPTRNYSRQRFEGFASTLSAKKHTVEHFGYALSTHSGVKWKALERAIFRQLVNLTEPTAILAKDDISAAAIIKSVQKIDMHIPDDLCVLGVGNCPILCNITTPGLSSIVVPAYEIGYRAADTLYQLIDGKTVSPTTIAKFSVRKRGSTSLRSIDDKLVATAHAAMQHTAAHNNLKIEALCSELGVSHTTLNKRYKAVFSESPKTSFNRMRFTEATRLLRETRHPVKNIALDMGFTSPEEFNRFFKKQSSHTPQEYRNQHQ
jgi:LacI family transcriptional regulator